MGAGNNNLQRSVPISVILGGRMTLIMPANGRIDNSNRTQANKRRFVVSLAKRAEDIRKAIRMKRHFVAIAECNKILDARVMEMEPRRQITAIIGHLDERQYALAEGLLLQIDWKDTLYRIDQDITTELADRIEDMIGMYNQRQIAKILGMGRNKIDNALRQRRRGTI